MKYLAVMFTALFLAGCQQSAEKTSEQIYNTNKNGVVLISFNDTAGKAGAGTGFLVGENTIVTNNHVVELVREAGELKVRSPNSLVQYDAKIVHADPAVDLAVIELKDWNEYKKNEKPSILKFANSDNTKVGDKIVVIGHPWGLEWSMSEGIVSAKNRRIDENPKFLDQIDAHLFQGNSGGPVFDAYGKVTCVSELIFVREGGSYGFCIPSKLVQKVLHDFDAYGEVRWRAMNVSIGLTEDRSSIILKKIEPKGAADNAGLLENDKVLKVFTKNRPGGLEVNDPNELITEIATLPGDEQVVQLLIDRNGKQIVIDVKTNYRLSKDYPKASGR